MSRLSKGEQEFISDFGDLAARDATAHAIAPSPAEAAAQPPVAGGPQVIDARGISSPLPVLRAHRALRAMQPGQELKVITTGGETLAEFQALSKYVLECELVSQEDTGGEIVHLLRRKR